jgi:hypothetical protein
VEKYPCQFFVNGAKRGRHWLAHKPAPQEAILFDSLRMIVISCILDIDHGEYLIELDYQVAATTKDEQPIGWMETTPLAPERKHAETTQTRQSGKSFGGKRH